MLSPNEVIVKPLHMGKYSREVERYFHLMRCTGHGAQLYSSCPRLVEFGPRQERQTASDATELATPRTLCSRALALTNMSMYDRCRYELLEEILIRYPDTYDIKNNDECFRLDSNN
jgi:hypothetical protein